MASSKKEGVSERNAARNDSTRQTRASLPPKPVSQKRTRNGQSSSGAAPPAQASQQSKPRRSWSRRSASWTAEEDAKLIELVRKETSVPPSITASKTWSRVAAQLTKRTGKQCRERYLNQLKPGIRRDPWSQEEERILHEAHARYGNKWVTIASQLPGRTDNCVKNHWNSMLRKRQRREAALRASQSEAAAVRNAAESPPDPEHRSEADHSIFTGCATPSGASSSVQDMPTPSGIPSPFTASSPITPRRDAKLQISSLVASSSKELPMWTVPCFTRGSARAVSTANNIPGVDQSVHGSAQFTQSGKAADSSRLAYTSDQNVLLGRNRPATSHAASVPDSTSGERKSSAPQRQLRRSSRFASTSEKGANGSAGWTSRVQGVQKRIISKGKRVSEGVGNPLAALAAAASSVPPSPLTPESRFSGTSRSRSVSPSPRLLPSHGRSVGVSSSSTEEVASRVAGKGGSTFARAERISDEGAEDGKARDWHTPEGDSGRPETKLLGEVHRPSEAYNRKQTEPSGRMKKA